MNAIKNPEGKRWSCAGNSEERDEGAAGVAADAAGGGRRRSCHSWWSALGAEGELERSRLSGSLRRRRRSGLHQVSAPDFGQVDLTSGMQQRQVGKHVLEPLLLGRANILLFLTLSIAVRGGVGVGAPFRLSTLPITAALVLPLLLPRLRTVLLHLLRAVVLEMPVRLPSMALVG